MQNILGSCSQTLYALKTLQVHGLLTTALHTIYKSFILVKIMYAVSAWFGFAAQSDKRHIDIFIQRGKQSGSCPVNTQTTELDEAADSKLL